MHFTYLARLFTRLNPLRLLLFFRSRVFFYRSFNVVFRALNRCLRRRPAAAAA